MTTDQKAPTAFITKQQRALRERLPFSDTRDFTATERGFLGSLEPAVIRAEDGRVVWDSDSYGFLHGEAPESVSPSLWRQSTLVARHGLFEVVEGIYQVRGLDLSNTTFVEGDTGVVVIDPLLTRETGAAALALYRKHRGNRPITGMIYTHCHVDHFGGVKGMISAADVASGKVPVLAPAGFTEHAVSENVYAGTAMGRRSGYMYGAALARGPRGQVGAGLGQTTSTGMVTLIPPTADITATGQEETIDGVLMVFQLTPGTEAPAEMNIFLPAFNALCTAENATHNQHNLLTLRGAVVRDPRAWSNYLTETITLFGGKAEVVFASHHWPTWGAANVVEYLSVQRDLYGYLHDQTLRMLNKGMVGAEIAEEIKLPPALEKAWHTHGYYGSVSHNVKAIYQRYLGWFDGNPAHLWQHPPVEAARRYVQYMGGADAVVDKARASYDAGDLRWVAEVLNHVIFAEPGHAAARELLADTYEQLGYGSENGTWRSFYLSGATELRDGSFGTPLATVSPDMVSELSPPMLFDALAVQVNGPAAWDEHLTIDVHLTDADKTYRVELSNGVLTHTSAQQTSAADVTFTTTQAALPAMAMGKMTAESLTSAGIKVSGDPAALDRLAAVLEEPDPEFAIVTADKE
jgi:alkyl sulfatase BDS1-like metallo-beta-lactamase superfamily hydrolase